MLSLLWVLSVRGIRKPLLIVLMLFDSYQLHDSVLTGGQFEVESHRSPTFVHGVILAVKANCSTLSLLMSQERFVQLLSTQRSTNSTVS